MVTPTRTLAQAVAERTERQGACLLWTRSSSGGRDGHPQLKLGGKVLNVRRELAKEYGLEPAPSEVVRMSCGHGLCLERAHMVLADRGIVAAANSRAGTRDRAKVSATAKRHTRSASSLTVTDVRTIFASDESPRRLAARYGKSRSMIHRIKRREVWADVLVTEAKTPPSRYAPEAVPCLFAGLGIGCYFPGESAISKTYGAQR